MGEEIYKGLKRYKSVIIIAIVITVLTALYLPKSSWYWFRIVYGAILSGLALYAAKYL